MTAPTPRSAEAVAREIVDRLWYAETPVLWLDAIAAALTAHATAAVERYARTVDDPAAMHLHYDGCPFAPYADVPRWEMPDPRPACTCAEAHKAAYWKGQWMLERGQREVDATAAVAAERERCATFAATHGGGSDDIGAALIGLRIAAAIRRPPEEPRDA